MGRSTRDRLYASYDQHLPPEDPRRAAALERFARRYLPPVPSRILDLGCGDGALLRAAGRCGHVELHGVDSSAPMVERARAAGVAAVLGDAFDYIEASAAGAFDCVIAYDVLEHLEQDEQLALLDGVHRVLAPGGRLVLHVPNGEGLFVGQVRYGDATHVTAFTDTSLTQLLGATGYTDLQFHEDAPTFTGVKRAVRAAAWQVIRRGLMVVSAIETGWYNPRQLLTRNLIALAFKRT